MDILIESIKYFAIIWVAMSLINTVILPAIRNTLPCDSKWNKKLHVYICQKCVTFWFTLVITWDPYLAAIASVLSYLVEKNTSTKL